MAATKKPVLAAGFHRQRFKIGEHRETVLKEICEEARQYFPHYFKLNYADPIALLKWRRYVRERCVHDHEFRVAVWEACRQDFMLFCVTFAWIFEPRPHPRRMPFHPFTSQVSLAAWLCETFGVRSTAINKTRGIGLSWLVAAFCVWKWLFEQEVSIALLSKDEDSLDKGEGPNPLMGKLQYVYDHLPGWAKAANPLKRNLGDHTFINRRNRAIIQGFVSTGQKLRGARFTWLFADEFAFYAKNVQEEWLTAAGGTVNSMCFGSTWGDYDDMFHFIFYEDSSNMLRVSAFWWNDYERWKGAYRMEFGKAVFVDKDYQHVPDYPFGEPEIGEDSMLRSPWVDGELMEPGVNKLKTLRDLYGMIVCEQSNNFIASEIRKAAQASVGELNPSAEGKLEVHGDRVLIQPTKKGDIRTWHNVPNTNRGPYTGYADLGGGAGLHYSVFTVLDRSGEQVLEYGTNSVRIVPFAANVVAICRWLGGDEGDGWVLIDFDCIGPLSASFTGELTRLHYGNIWESTISDAKTKRRKLRAGELPTYLGTACRDKGVRNFNELSRAILEMECVVRSQNVVEDMLRCSKDENDQPKFPKSGAGHGDFLQAAAGAWWRLRSSVDLSARDGGDAENPVEYRQEIWKPKQELWSASYR